MISIVIPLYNKEAIIERTIQSVLSQSFQDFELIIINDGSTDGSMEVVKSITDDRILVVEQENGGPGKARNIGVTHSHGEWILFLDADDELADGALEHLWNSTITHSNANIIDGSFVVRAKDGEQPFVLKNRVVQNNYKEFFYRRSLPSTGHTLFKSELVKKYPYNTNIRRYEDVELIMRILKEAKIVTTSKMIFYVNAAFSSASTARKTISEDFLGHLDFKNKSFWEYMCLYQFYLGEREHYPEEVRKLYPNLHRRYDLQMMLKMLIIFKKLFL